MQMHDPAQGAKVLWLAWALTAKLTGTSRHLAASAGAACRVAQLNRASALPSRCLALTGA